MKKIINNNTIHFYDNENSEIMYIEHCVDDCIWYFNSENIINVTEDMELYNLLEKFMNQNYKFNDEVLINFKDKNKLIWYSDCYYNPCDEWSTHSVSCLNIERKDKSFKIWCTKKLDEIIDRPHKTYGISFSPAGNGKFSKNLNTGKTLQDDFINYIYQQLLVENKILKKLK